jgi:hypothetical protein
LHFCKQVIIDKSSRNYQHFYLIHINQLSKGVNIMGFFGKILEKLGLKKDEAPAETVAPVVPVAAPAKPATPVAKPVAEVVKPKPVAEVEKDDTPKPSTISKMEAPKPVAVSEVDVVKHLEQLSLGKGLDWKVSIVDLLKLLEIDSSREARNELATELGCPADLMGDSAKMNVWLHKEVLKQIAKNGGNIPASLLD